MCLRQYLLRLWCEAVFHLAGVERALRAGLQQGMQWLIHADPDELLYPQNESFDIANGASVAC